MCISPISIPNPYKNHHLHPLYKRTSFLHDTISDRIYIPCGVCSECIALKQMYLVQRVQMESFDSFLFFSTLTYNNEFLPKYICPNGIKIPFADILHLQNMFKRLRNDNAFGRPFRYLAVSERGKEKSRPHFHILWFLPRYDNEDYVDGIGLQSKLYDTILNYWSVNLGSKRVPHYVPLCTYHQKWRNGRLFSNYDTHFVTPSLSFSDGISPVAFYVSKYMLKQNDKERRLQRALKLNLSPEDYDEAFSIVKSKSLRSEHFGLRQTDYFSSYRVVKYLRDCVVKSKGNQYPCFFSPDSVATFPLSPYYKSKSYIYSFKDNLDFCMNNDSIFLDFNKTTEQCVSGVEYMSKIQKIVDSKDLSLEFDFLFD